MVFQWFGQESVPTHTLFRENWIFAGGATHRPENALGALKVDEVFSDLWKRFPENDVKNMARGDRLSSAVKHSRRRTRRTTRTRPWSPEASAKMLSYARRIKAKKKSSEG